MRIAIAGDFFVHTVENVKIGGDIVDIMNSCDYRVVNFEGPMDDGILHKVLKSGPRLKQSQASMSILNQLGVDALTLANNHIMDNGTDGYSNTRNQLYLNGLELFGTGCWDEAYSIKVVNVGGKRVGFLNVCEMQFGMLYDKWSQNENTIGCAWINHPDVNQHIMKAKSEVDFLIAICHAGVENVELPLPEWRTRYREMIDYGCDAVIAHHPHVVQGYEFYKGRPICYSLGNFCFQKANKEKDERTNYGSVAVLSLEDNHISLNMHGCIFEGGLLRLVDDKIWHKKMTFLCNLLEENYINQVDQMSLSLLNQYWDLFAMGGLFNPQKMDIKNVGRLVLKRYSYIHLLNNLQCESHKWCISRALRILSNE